jgi:hypothetical protein
MLQMRKATDSETLELWRDWKKENKGAQSSSTATDKSVNPVVVASVDEEDEVCPIYLEKLACTLHAHYY